MLLRALIKQEGEIYSAICLELDVASQGDSPVEARENLRQAVELYLEGFESDELGYAIRVIPCDIWQEFFSLEEKYSEKSRINFYSIVAKEDGSRIIEAPGNTHLI